MTDEEFINDLIDRRSMLTPPEYIRLFDTLTRLHAALLAYEKMGAGDEETKRALVDVDTYGPLKYPTGSDRAFLCYAAQVLARALRSSWKQLEDVTREADGWKKIADAHSENASIGWARACMLVKERDELRARLGRGQSDL